MIMPRKTRRMIVIISIIMLLSIIAIAFLLLYMNTDMFRSSSTLFTKYMGQNLENMEAVYDRVGTSDYNTLLQQNKYTTETLAKVNYTANIEAFNIPFLSGTSINDILISLIHNIGYFYYNLFLIIFVTIGITIWLYIFSNKKELTIN